MRQHDSGEGGGRNVICSLNLPDASDGYYGMEINASIGGCREIADVGVTMMFFPLIPHRRRRVKVQYSVRDREIN